MVPSFLRVGPNPAWPSSDQRVKLAALTSITVPVACLARPVASNAITCATSWGWVTSPSALAAAAMRDRRMRSTPPHISPAAFAGPRPAATRWLVRRHGSRLQDGGTPRCSRRDSFGGHEPLEAGSCSSRRPSLIGPPERSMTSFVNRTAFAGQLAILVAVAVTNSSISSGGSARLRYPHRSAVAASRSSPPRISSRARDRPTSRGMY